MDSANLQILSLSDLYSRKTGKKESTIASYSAKQAYAFRRLREGCSITIRRANKITQWFSDHWPADLLWPEDIPRPEPAAELTLCAGADSPAKKSE